MKLNRVQVKNLPSRQHYTVNLTSNLLEFRGDGDMVVAVHWVTKTRTALWCEVTEHVVKMHLNGKCRNSRRSIGVPAQE